MSVYIARCKQHASIQVLLSINTSLCQLVHPDPVVNQDQSVSIGWNCINPDAVVNQDQSVSIGWNCMEFLFQKREQSGAYCVHGQNQSQGLIMVK